jgi:hypothetical protein
MCVREKIAVGEADGWEKRRDGGYAPTRAEKNFGTDSIDKTVVLNIEFLVDYQTLFYKKIP